MAKRSDKSWATNRRTRLYQRASIWTKPGRQISMLKYFITELLWVFMFLFLLIMEKYIPIYVYERINLPASIISWVSWGFLILCGLRVSWYKDLSAWWLCCVYAFIISIFIFIYNSFAYSLHQSSDFPDVVGSIWLSAIFFALSFCVIFIGFFTGIILKYLLSKLN